MRYFILLLLFATTSAFGADATRLATREWVRRAIDRAIFLRSSSDVTTTATVTTNQNGTLTLTSPWYDETLTNATSITLTMTAPTIRTATPTVRFADLFFLSAYASTGNELTMTITSGSYYNIVLGNIEFDFGDGLELTCCDEMPEIPNSTHVCEIGSDCNCAGAGLTREETDADYAETYQQQVTASEFLNEYKDIKKWTDESWIEDANGLQVSTKSIAKSDAFLEGIKNAFMTYVTRYQACKNAWYTKHHCPMQNPQHTWATSSCGGNTWKICQRNAAHREGTPQHEYAGGNSGSAGHNCKCGAGPLEAHTLVSGNKVWNSTRTGWTATLVCSVAGCGYQKGEHSHTCVHVDCAACSGGDGCSEPCPTCTSGQIHNWSTMEANASCSHCTCEGCTKHRPVAANETAENYHTGWHPCGEDAEDNNDNTAIGAHCACKCLDFGHNAGTAHKRQERATPIFSDYPEDNLKRYHKKSTMTDCERCGYEQWKLEPHEYPEEYDKHFFVNNDVCGKMRKCNAEGCGHEDKEENPSGSHVHSGSPKQCSNISASVCRHWWECSQCLTDVYSDSCNHIRNTSNECKCQCGCGYQFEHVYNIDNGCGLKSCACGKIDPSYDGSHIYANGNDGVRGHFCKCSARKIAPHALEMIERNGRTYRTCVIQGCGYEVEDTQHVHAFTNCVCVTCGKKCTTCGGNHVFHGATCHTCTCANCTATPENQSQHTGWHECSDADTDANDGTANGFHCVCSCGKFSHSSGSLHDYVGATLTREQIGSGEDEDYEIYHWKREACTRGCGHKTKKVERHTFVDKNEYRKCPEDSDVCQRKRQCSKDGCAFVLWKDGNHKLSSVTNSAIAYGLSDPRRDYSHKYRMVCTNCNNYTLYDDAPHALSTNIWERTRPVGTGELGTHRCYRVCNDPAKMTEQEGFCEIEVDVTKSADHDDNRKVFRLTNNDGSSTGSHDISNYCGTCGLDWYFIKNEACYRWTGWELGDEDSHDKATCKDCGGLGVFAHNLKSVDNENHYCSNGSGHLFQKHEAESNGLIVECRICGHIFEDNREPFHLCSVCSNYHVCYCSACDGTFNALVCLHMNSQGGSSSTTDKFTDTEVTADMYMMHTVNNTTIRNVDGSDPVIIVRARGFKAAWSNCTQLVTVNFNKLKRADEEAFKMAFMGDTSLREVFFTELDTIGTNAFANAFDGCSGLKYVDLRSLHYDGPYGFDFSDAHDLLNVDLTGAMDVFSLYPFRGGFVQTIKIPHYLNYRWMNQMFASQYWSPSYINTFESVDVSNCVLTNGTEVGSTKTFTFVCDHAPTYIEDCLTGERFIPKWTMVSTNRFISSAIAVTPGRPVFAVSSNRTYASNIHTAAYRYGIRDATLSGSTVTIVADVPQGVTNLSARVSGLTGTSDPISRDLQVYKTADRTFTGMTDGEFYFYITISATIDGVEYNQMGY